MTMNDEKTDPPPIECREGARLNVVKQAQLTDLDVGPLVEAYLALNARPNEESGDAESVGRAKGCPNGND